MRLFQQPIYGAKCAVILDSYTNRDKLLALYQCDVELDDAEVSSIVAFLRTLTGEYQGQKLTSDNKQEN